MPPSKTLDLSIRPLLEDGDLNGLSKRVTKALSNGVFDPAAMKRFESNLNSMGLSFNQVIAKAKLVGLGKAADDWTAKMYQTEEILKKTVKEMADLQAKKGKSLSDAEYAAHNRRLNEDLDALNFRLNKEMQATEAILDRRKKALDEWDTKTMNEKGAAIADGFSDSVSDMWNNVKASDLGGLSKALSTSLGKAASGVGVAGGGGAAAAGLETTLAGMATAAATLAAVVAAFAAVVKIAMDADAQAKEFNSTILQGASAADFFSETSKSGFADVEKGLDDIQNAAFTMANEFRMVPKDIMAITSSMNEAGFTFKEMQGRVSGFKTEMEAYADVTRTAIVFSKQLGQTTATIAEQSAKWTDEFGMGLDSIQEGFQAIFAGAMQSGIGVKRFYTMVTSATSNMALYNSSIEETAALLSTLSKSLGDENASQFVQGLQKSFADEGYTDSIKRVILTGGKTTKKIMENDAVSLGKAFTTKVDGLSPEIQKSLQETFANTEGLGPDFLKDLAGGDMGALKKLGGMGGKDKRKLIQQVRTSDPAMARQLETLVGLTKGMQGGTIGMAAALDKLGPGGALAMQLNSGMSILGKPISEASGVQLAMLQQSMGLSRQQINELQRVDGQLRGNFSALEDLRKEAEDGRKFTQQEMEAQAKEFGAFIDENGKVVAGSVTDASKRTDVGGDLEKYVQSQGETFKDSLKGGMSAQEAMAKQIVSNTASISVLMENTIAQGLKKIADLLNLVYNAVSGSDPAIAKMRDTLAETLEKQQAALLKADGESQQKLSDLRTALDQANGEARAPLEEKIKKMEKDSVERKALAETRGKEAMSVRSKTAEGVLRAGFNAFTGQGGNSMVGAGLASNTEAQLGLTQEGRGKSYYADAGGEYTGQEYLSMSEDEKAKRRASAQTVSQWGGAQAAGAGLGSTSASGLEDVRRQLDAADSSASSLENIQGYALSSYNSSKDNVAATEAIDDNMTKNMVAANEISAAKQAGTAMGLSGGDLTTFMSKITRGDKSAQEQMQKAYRSTNDPTLRDLGLKLGTKMEDFVYHGGSGGGTITPINQADQLLGAKPGGPVAQMLGASSGGSPVSIQINGGDTAAVYRVVKKVLQESGIRPPQGKG